MKPLVSVPVITYNSSNTIIETLDSIYNQTYPNIELIISDDCSTDNTVELCGEWVEKNKERFVRTEIITVEKNTGVSANGNRARKACQGVWLKGVAGDDLLLPNSISDNIDFIEEHPDAIYVWSRCKSFGMNEDRCAEMDAYYNYDFFSWTPQEQYEFLTLHGNCIPAVSVFYNREKNEKLGIKNDERIPLLEDQPRWVNLIKKGVRLYFMDKLTVMWRLNENGLFSSGKSSLAFQKSNALFYIYYGFPNDIKKNPKIAIYRYMQKKIFVTESVFWKIMAKIYKIGILHESRYFRKFKKDR